MSVVKSITISMMTVGSSVGVHTITQRKKIAVSLERGMGRRWFRSEKVSPASQGFDHEAKIK